MNDSTSTTSSTRPSPTDGAVVVAPWVCPPWCGDPPKHYFEPCGDGMDSSRLHELELTEVIIRRGRTGSPMTISVTLHQEEVVVAAGAGGVVLEPAFVAIGDGSELTPEETRRLGDALLAAADRLDSITTSTSAGQQR